MSTLRALSTGFTKVSDAGVAMLSRLPNLAALALYAETVTNAALRAAASLHALTSLSLSNCYEARPGLCWLGNRPHFLYCGVPSGTCKASASLWCMGRVHVRHICAITHSSKERHLRKVAPLCGAYS